MGKKIHFLLFSALIFSSAAIRFNNLTYPVNSGETHRDFLVAGRILEMQQFPKTGPCCIFNLEFGIVRHHPAYYYFTALLLTPKDDILFLSTINIIFQLLSIFIVYFLASKLFGPAPALIATALFSFNPEILRQSLFYWQPHLMQFTTLLSFLTLYFAHKKNKFSLIILSIFLFLLSAAIHPSAFGLLPFFALLIFKMLGNQKAAISKYISLILFFVSLAFLYFKPMTFAQNEISFSLKELIATTPKELFQNLISLKDQYFELFTFDRHGQLLSLQNLILGAFLFYLLAYMLNYKFIGKREKTYSLIILGAIVQFSLLALIFKVRVWLFYFTPIFPLIFILVAYIVYNLPPKHVILNATRTFIFFLLLFSFLPHFNSFYTRHLKSAKLAPNTITTIENNILEIQKKYNYTSPDFFDLKFYSQLSESPQLADLVFWSKLEKDFGRKFVEVGDSQNTFKPINKNDFVFLICQGDTPQCLNTFSAQFYDHSIMDGIHSNEQFNVYLAKKTSLN